MARAVRTDAPPVAPGLGTGGFCSPAPAYLRDRRGRRRQRPTATATVDTRRSLAMPTPIRVDVAADVPVAA
jgi:hypothetical protein